MMAFVLSIVPQAQQFMDLFAPRHSLNAAHYNKVDFEIEFELFHFHMLFFSAFFLCSNHCKIGLNVPF